MRSFLKSLCANFQGLIGVVVGGAISYFIQQSTLEKQRFQEDKRSIISLYPQIANNVYSNSSLFLDVYADPDQEKNFKEISKNLILSIKELWLFLSIYTGEKINVSNIEKLCQFSVEERLLFFNDPVAHSEKFEKTLYAIQQGVLSIIQESEEFIEKKVVLLNAR